MLSEKTMEIVKSTAPVLEERGTEITTYFYKKMFENHPELLNIFNHANQSQGRQQTALANAVYAAAKHIDNLDAIVPVVIQVAHKHRSLGIKPEHYPIVGKYLLIAIKEVLGEAATDDIMKAWEEAYGVIADAFINVEAGMYKEAETQKGGWLDFKPFVVAKKVKESEVITSFYLKPADGSPVPTYLAGQYITVKLKADGDKYTLNRQYSLSCAPGHDYFRISVKRESEREPVGKVSNYLHDHVNEGDKIEVSAPAGDFVLNMQEEEPVALISGGVGVTPMFSMFETLANAGSKRKVTFINASRNEKIQAFKSAAKELETKLENGKAYFAYDEKPSDNSLCDHIGHINREFLEKVVDSNSVCYVCGPVPFMQSIVRILKEMGISDNNIRYEFFGPAMALEA
ncbi:nitric oxide dioxygenase [Oikeobacillus pervagus]|uniref:Flavohemoprotein n=1 Tax=Oikeobacillus pervagus TaxID=1325931 RepID=A0AAJ1T602_9BACI|nr:NO-inducible flavohemoprotein [Oikeobacillus pervagus]MDQ0216504.1 nitric oxide dioxygenase [Oikeobacillus pervagus]